MIPAQYRKAVTFSYDDGNIQDIRLVKLFNQYRMKCTFNLNSGLDSSSEWLYRDMPVRRLNLRECRDLYAGHEIAVHGSQHRNLTELSPADLKSELHSDRDALTEIFGCKPVGMAYAYGAYNQTVLNAVKEAGLQYGRTVKSSHNFNVQENLLTFCPTCHHDDEELFTLAESFLRAPDDKIQIFYIWGHSYEFDGNHNWDRIEKLLAMLAGKSDIFYGTNAEVLL